MVTFFRSVPDTKSKYDTPDISYFAPTFYSALWWGECVTEGIRDGNEYIRGTYKVYAIEIPDTFPLQWSYDSWCEMGGTDRHGYETALVISKRITNASSQVWCRNQQKFPETLIAECQGKVFIFTDNVKEEMRIKYAIQIILSNIRQTLSYYQFFNIDFFERHYKINDNYDLYQTYAKFRVLAEYNCNQGFESMESAINELRAANLPYTMIEKKWLLAKRVFKYFDWYYDSVNDYRIWKGFVEDNMLSSDIEHTQSKYESIEKYFIEIKNLTNELRKKL
jgi:hypothetical protein